MVDSAPRVPWIFKTRLAEIMLLRVTMKALDWTGQMCGSSERVRKAYAAIMSISG
jgi:hypothetical protein